jgi:phospholipid transport system transporter-binding protein
MTFATAGRLLQAGLSAWSHQSAPLEIDMSSVLEADSAGLAVVLQWLAQSHQARRAVRIVAVPDSLRAIARISELDELLEQHA